jgi:hypothetical protein
MRLVYVDPDSTSVELRCECKNFIIINKDQFKELNTNYVIPKEDVELVCAKCGKAHTESVIILEDQHPAQSKLNIPKCPTCGSPQIERISTLTKATSFGFFGVFSRDFNKTFHCKKCNYRW